MGEAKRRLDEQIESLATEIHALDDAMRQAESKDDYNALLLDYRAQFQFLSRVAEDYLANLFALRALEESLAVFERDKIPSVLERSCEIFKRVTDGAYTRIEARDQSVGKGASKSAAKQTGRFIAIDASGREKSPDQLSAGTREQLYLALRLAHVDLYCADSEPLPLLLDDVLVNSDSARAERMLAVLAEFTDQRRQAVLLTCRRETRELARKILGDDAVISLPALEAKESG